MKKINNKNLYTLLIICISLILLGVGSTYAVFTASYEINNPIYIVSNLTYDDNIMEAMEVTLNPDEVKTLTLSLNNTSGSSLNYNIWYIDEGYDISIGTVNSEPVGSLNNNVTKTITVEIINNNSEVITTSVGISSSKKEIVLDSSMKTIKKQNVLMTVSSSSVDTTFLRGNLKRSDVASVTFLDNQDYPEGVLQ